MSVSDSNEDSSSREPPPDFEEYLGFEEYIPHKVKLDKSNKDNKNEDKNNFINSTLYCLTNLKYFLVYLYKCYDLESKAFKALNQVIRSVIDNIKEGKYKYNSFFFIEFILDNIKLFENKSYRNPRILIDCILNEFFLMNNSSNLLSIKSNLSSIKEESSNSNEISILFFNQISLSSTSSNSTINFSVKENYGIEQNTYIEDNISIVIKKTRKCSDINCGQTETIYKNMKTLHFNLKDIKKEYSIYDCFYEFLKKEKKMMKKVNALNVLKEKYVLKTIYFINSQNQL